MDDLSLELWEQAISGGNAGDLCSASSKTQMKCDFDKYKKKNFNWLNAYFLPCIILDSLHTSFKLTHIMTVRSVLLLLHFMCEELSLTEFRQSCPSLYN